MFRSQNDFAFVDSKAHGSVNEPTYSGARKPMVNPRNE